MNEQTATADDWLAKDKLAHLTVSMAAVGFSNHILAFESNNTGGQARAGSISFTLSLGLVKEIHDGTKKDNHFSFKDLTADILGIMIGAAIFTGN